MAFTQNTDIKMYYELIGEGLKVLYINGSGGDLRAKPNMMDGPLTKNFQLLSYDQRGLGQTDKPDSIYTMEQYADDAAMLLDELGWQSAHVIGVSFGGMVALNLAVRHPDRIDKLVLCCTSPGGTQPSYPLHEIPDELDDKERLMRMLVISDTRHDEKWQKDNPKTVKAIVDFSLNTRHTDQQLPEFKLGAKKQLAARRLHNVQKQLGNIQSPTLVCAGKYDGLAYVQNQQAMVDALPNAHLEWFEGGHAFMIQDKLALPRIVAFLKD